MKFVYPSARESEMRESLYGKKGRYDLEALKLMNNRGNNIRVFFSLEK